ncbi:sodium/hydrogen exchanger family protein [Truncatella angustata]|uniref:Sodium/hydrogen exchanger family protein n=1 Tax=Truncatella angustata TaxID=152316 RepID=A0A9P8UVE1_9PEZI|nr:sodium/hydrogen exchanger family protein [Truncatella angustata]KAH6658905.1 sodium/hydrogen exchanger family protein [Truncatella angustata]
MPTTDVSELNIIAITLGTFTVVFGLIAFKIKNVWYLGDALPSVLVGIMLGPIAARVLDADRWIDSDLQALVTLGIMRLMIGIQLVIAGYQLPKRYLRFRIREILVCLLPIMTLMWLATTACVLATIPKMRILPALIIAACVTSTDPVLSQAVAKSPFSDKFVARPLREIISAEAGANDGFASPFLMLGISFILQMAKSDGSSQLSSAEVGAALRYWVVEALLYTVALAIAYGAVVGYVGRKVVEYSVSRKWIDSESYLLFPTALGLFVVGTCGAIGTSDLLACFIAGCALNWDGRFHAETKRRHDEVNNCVDVLLSYGGFMFIGVTLPWDQFHQPDITGITWARLIGLGFIVLIFRRIPALLVCCKMMPAVVQNWKEAVFMGYFGPIGVGAIYYLEHTQLMLLSLGMATQDEQDLLLALTPVVYFLAFFSIVVHGLSIPALNAAYTFCGTEPLKEDAEQIRRRSVYVATPTNAIRTEDGRFIAFNRFDRPDDGEDSHVKVNILPRFQRPSYLPRENSTNETLAVHSSLGDSDTGKAGGNRIVRHDSMEGPKGERLV